MDPVSPFNVAQQINLALTQLTNNVLQLQQRSPGNAKSHPLHEFTALFYHNVFQYFEQWLSEWSNKPPVELYQTYQAFWLDCWRLTYATTSTNDATTAERGSGIDRRFQHQHWETNLNFKLTKQSYLLFKEYTLSFVKHFSSKEPSLQRRVEFYTQSWLDALAPTNFGWTNPEIYQRSIEQGGKNILQGYQYLLEDMRQGKGWLHIPMTDYTQFQIGVNLAKTAGNIIYQNDLLQLIQYCPTTEKVYQRPLLMVPPWINKYYILDLQPQNSLVKWAVDQGFTVFMISWINPNHQHRAKGFEEYLCDGLIAAMNAVVKTTGSNELNTLGFCVGGTLLGASLAYLSHQQKIKVTSATFLATLLDFEQPGEISTFIDEKQVAMIEAAIAKQGYFDGRLMQSTFSSLRANELLWNAYIQNYLKGERPRALDFLYWNSDVTNIPAKLHSYFLRNFYLANKLVQPNASIVQGQGLDLAKISMPIYYLATEKDHITPWQSNYKSAQYLSGLTTFVLAGSGHIAGVINPPINHKYGYYHQAIRETLPAQAQSWLDCAQQTSGSWWTHWGKWLTQYSGIKIDALDPSGLMQGVIEPAPGSYVKTKATDQE